MCKTPGSASDEHSFFMSATALPANVIILKFCIFVSIFFDIAFMQTECSF